MKGFASCSVAVCVLVALLYAPRTSGTHFRFQAINWSRDPSSLNVVNFEIQQAWRYTFFYPTYDARVATPSS